MNNIDTVAHMNMHYTQYWAHCALFIDAQLCHIAPVAQVCLARVIPSMHVHLCVASWLFSLHPSPVFYFVPPFSFQPFQMFFSEFNERSRSKPLCDFRLGTVATSDHETPLTLSMMILSICLISRLKKEEWSEWQIFLSWVCWSDCFNFTSVWIFWLSGTRAFPHLFLCRHFCKHIKKEKERFTFFCLNWGWQLFNALSLFLACVLKMTLNNFSVHYYMWYSFQAFHWSFFVV